MDGNSLQEIMIMTSTQLTVPSIIMVPGGLLTASLHISMVPISIIQSLVHLMALFGPMERLELFPQVHRDENSL